MAYAPENKKETREKNKSTRDNTVDYNSTDYQYSNRRYHIIISFNKTIYIYIL